MSNSAEFRGKKESPTVKPWDFYRKMGVKTGNSVVKTRKYLRKEGQGVSNHHLFRLFSLRYHGLS